MLKGRVGLQVSGEFLRGSEKLPCTLAGTWDKELNVVMPNGAKRRVWQIAAMPEAESRCALANTWHCSKACSPAHHGKLVVGLVPGR